MRCLGVILWGLLGACGGEVAEVVPEDVTANDVSEVFVPSTLVDCVGKALGTPCDDGDPCTLEDLCAGGICVGGEYDLCEDEGPCRTGECVTGEGCVFTDESEGTACDLDGDACSPEACDGLGACVVAGEVTSCEEAALGDPCWSYECDPVEGCVRGDWIEGVPCDDGDECTEGDACLAGACGGLPLACEDGDPCTDNEGCVDGICGDGTPKDCADDDPCTVDSCDPVTGGCEHIVEEGLPCNDADLCTSLDSCVQGACVGVPVDCDDGSECTADSCSPVTGGCVNEKSDACVCFYQGIWYPEGSFFPEACLACTCYGDQSVICGPIEDCEP